MCRHGLAVTAFLSNPTKRTAASDRQMHICASGPSHQEDWMRKTLIISIAALGIAAAAIAASAQGKMDCGATYKNFWDKYQAAKGATATPEQLADVSRTALRAYDACQAGDEFNARSLFDRLAAEAR